MDANFVKDNTHELVGDTMQDQAFTDCLRVLEAVAAYGGTECESGQECGMPADCVDVMISIFSSSTQPQEYRLQAGHITASLLNSHKCQRKALRSAVSLS